MSQVSPNQDQNLKANAPLNPLEQRVWVKEQEVSALKVQNRHLLAKLEEATQASKPNQLNTQFIALEVQKSLQPVIQELEKSIKGAFEILQSTMRGIYQQSQRCQQAVEEIGAHSRDIEVRANEQRKIDHAFFQEKIMNTVNTFSDRLERQVENRLRALSGIDALNTKQNEMLSDVDLMKSMMTGIHQNSDLGRNELFRIEKDTTEISGQLHAVQAQAQQAQELVRDALQQIQNHRSEFKLLRGEMRSILEKLGRLKPVETLVEVDVPQSKEDITLILDRLQSQKEELIKESKATELLLRAASNEVRDVRLD